MAQPASRLTARAALARDLKVDLGLNMKILIEKFRGYFIYFLIKFRLTRLSGGSEILENFRFHIGLARHCLPQKNDDIDYVCAGNSNSRLALYEFPYKYILGR